MTDVNPFQFGALALDEAFTDREAEIAELRADVRNGQDVVVFAPRRYGKSSLVWRATQELARDRVLVASVDLMTAPTPAKLAEKLARAIHDDIASPLLRARERLRIFGDLKVTPTITIDPQSGAPAFSFSVTERPEDIDATIERLLELPAQLGADRKRQVALVLDEFQEVVDIDPKLPRLMRAVFQTQPEVGHVYLGSKRHMLRKIFSDENEPFWRSAKQMELGMIAVEKFAPFLERQFERSGRFISPEAIEAILADTGGHPYATQELAYFTWQEIGSEERAEAADVETALAKVLRSEHAHFSLLWERASAVQRLLLVELAHEPGRPLSGDYRQRHNLPGPSTVQRAVESLERAELVARDRGAVRIVEPFLAAWLLRDMRGP
ncbi:MAG: ATP-binding protein [Actinomycetota bacterium]|nr:ATP-binding protein [Actinomycetota bacterium]